MIAIGLGGEISEQQSPFPDSDWIDNVHAASIAVLPFVNMSPDKDNAYFADGISEELLNGLAKVDGLQVTARTSSFSLRDQNLDIRQIGKKLGVANVLEGSVRVAGDKFRVTVQLIDSQSGIHRWSDTYDRPMNDIFAVQDDVAKNVVLAMKDALQLDGELTDSIGTTQNSEAYGYFLRARALMRNLKLDGDFAITIERSIGYLTAAVELDPAFSDGYVAMADAYFELADRHHHWYQPAESENAAMLAADAARSAVEMAPNSSEALRAWGRIVDDRRQREKALRGAIDANPNNVAAYRDLLEIVIEESDVEKSLELARQFHLLDPLNAESSEFLASALVINGSLKEASDYYRITSQLRAGVLGKNVHPNEEYLELIAGLSTKPLELDLDTHLRLGLQRQCSGDFELSISSDAYTGEDSAYLASRPDAVGWCNTVGGAPAEPYRGKYVRLLGMIKTRNAPEGATLWMRVDGPKLFHSLGFDDGAPDYIDTPDTDWRPYELNLYVPADAYVIWYGSVLAGQGEMWMDDFRFEVSDNPDFH